MPDSSTLWPALALAAIPSLAYVVALRAVDRYEPDPWWVLVAALLVGAIAVPLAAMATRAMLGQPFNLPHPYASSGPQPLVRVIEQFYCGVALGGFVYVVRREFDDALDAIAYGAAIGAGLGAAHNFLFAVDGTGQLGLSSLVVLIIAGLNNALYGAVFGAFLGYAYWYLAGSRRWIVIGFGLATAALLSALHDTLPYMIARLIGQPETAVGLLSRAIALSLNVLGLIALIVVVTHFWRHEAHVIRRYLRHEAELGTIDDADIDVVASGRSRLVAQWRLVRRGEWHQLRQLRRRFLVEGKLAFDHWHRVRLGRGDDDADRRTAALREELRGLSRAGEG